MQYGQKQSCQHYHVIEQQFRWTCLLPVIVFSSLGYFVMSQGSFSTYYVLLYVVFPPSNPLLLESWRILTNPLLMHI